MRLHSLCSSLWSSPLYPLYWLCWWQQHRWYPANALCLERDHSESEERRTSSTGRMRPSNHNESSLSFILGPSRWPLRASLAIILLSSCRLRSPLVVEAFTVGRTSYSSSETLRFDTSLEFKKKKKKQSGGGGASKSKGFSSGGGTSTAKAAAASSTRSSAAGSSGGGFGSSFRYAGEVRPGTQTAQKKVTGETTILKKPDYWKTGIPGPATKPFLPWMIEVKTDDEIAKMREAGALAREILDLAGRAVAAGVSTDEIDELVHVETIKRGAYPSPLNYRGFPKSCCTSVNEVICHGIPDDRKLKEGDIINIDITVYLDGFHGDCSEMFVAGGEEALDDAGRKLLQATYDCWIAACQIVKPGNHYKDIGAIIEDFVVPQGLSTVRNFCGHGIGQTFHTNPNIYHYRNNEPTGQMAVGHTFTIEPMICEGSARVLSWPDNWTATTIDGKRSAQFEHTLLVTEDGVEALTGKNENSPVHFWERESKVHQGIWLGTSQNAMQRQAELNKEKLQGSPA